MFASDGVHFLLKNAPQYKQKIQLRKEGSGIYNKIRISEKIIEFRRANNITQSEFGRLIGVSPQAVYKWEKEICYPDITMLPAIASLLGCGINEFFE